jgi:hypothetical protein
MPLYIPIVIWHSGYAVPGIALSRFNAGDDPGVFY